MQNRQKTKMSEPIRLMAPIGLLQAIDQAAQKRGLQRSSLVRLAVSEFLQRDAMAQKGVEAFDCE